MSIQSVPRPPVAPDQSKKILYIDNLKVGLMCLVVVQHALITYGVKAGWYYTERTTLNGAIIPMDLLAVINQSFFMGLFFFLSAYFMPGSYDKKGAARFVKDRLVRLGIPFGILFTHTFPGDDLPGFLFRKWKSCHVYAIYRRFS
jgi:peptidoglycan/LPS O-acetylase OafA/YrhL